jgi:hypothetical protein
MVDNSIRNIMPLKWVEDLVKSHLLFALYSSHQLLLLPQTSYGPMKTVTIPGQMTWNGHLYFPIQTQCSHSHGFGQCLTAQPKFLSSVKWRTHVWTLSDSQGFCPPLRDHSICPGPDYHSNGSDWPQWLAWMRVQMLYWRCEMRLCPMMWPFPNQW